jgi:predicted flap endonuclease-1-like 5' DNA nuclease
MRGVSTIAITLERVGSKAVESEAPSTDVEAEEVKAAPAKTVDVSEIKGVGKATEERLKKAGFATAESVAATETGELSEKTGISEKVAAKLIDSAKELLK